MVPNELLLIAQILEAAKYFSRLDKEVSVNSNILIKIEYLNGTYMVLLTIAIELIQNILPCIEILTQRFKVTSHIMVPCPILQGLLIGNRHTHKKWLETISIDPNLYATEIVFWNMSNGKIKIKI